MENALLEKPAFTVTVGELVNAIKDQIIACTPEPLKNIEPVKKYAYSIREGASEFHVSPVTFQAWKNKGLVKFTQVNRKLIIDLPGTLEKLSEKRNNKGK